MAQLTRRTCLERLGVVGEHVLTHAGKVHPQIRQEYQSAYAVWWRRVKYSEGGYASGSAATAPRSEPDWQEGAVSAARQALATLHQRAMRGAS